MWVEDSGALHEIVTSFHVHAQRRGVVTTVTAGRVSAASAYNPFVGGSLGGDVLDIVDSGGCGREPATNAIVGDNVQPIAARVS